MRILSKNNYYAISRIFPVSTKIRNRTVVVIVMAIVSRHLRRRTMIIKCNSRRALRGFHVRFDDRQTLDPFGAESIFYSDAFYKSLNMHLLYLQRKLSSSPRGSHSACRFLNYDSKKIIYSSSKCSCHRPFLFFL